MTTIEIKQTPPLDEEILEQWVRVTDDEEIHGVCATRSANEGWPWQVSIYVAEFIRDEPLQSELHEAVSFALSEAPGVAEAIWSIVAIGWLLSFWRDAGETPEPI